MEILSLFPTIMFLFDEFNLLLLQKYSFEKLINKNYAWLNAFS